MLVQSFIKIERRLLHWERPQTDRRDTDVLHALFRHSNETDRFSGFTCFTEVLLSREKPAWASDVGYVKEPSHHDVLASARLAFADFLGNVGKRP